MKNKKVVCLWALIFMFCLHLAYGRQQDKGRKILYYRNPMNPAITSKVPAKDNMGMDYIPVYAEEKGAMQEEEGVVRLSPRDVSLAGVTSEELIRRHLFKDIRTAGYVAYDPHLYKAEEEFIQALKTQKSLENSGIPDIKERADALVEAASLKLQLSGLSGEQIAELSLQEAADRSLVISDEKNPYVWVYADVYEHDLSWIRTAQPVKVTTVAFAGEEFNGSIAAIDPLFNPMTRSVRIRVKIGNPQLKLKAQMYADIFIEAEMSGEDGEHNGILAVPADAVLDTGMRKVVYLDLGNGSYLAREAQLGPEATAYVRGEKNNFYPVVSGLEEGDKVVRKANFLIDSQSRLSGVAASAYGGALGVEEEDSPQEMRMEQY